MLKIKLWWTRLGESSKVHVLTASVILAVIVLAAMGPTIFLMSTFLVVGYGVVWMLMAAVRDLMS